MLRAACQKPPNEDAILLLIENGADTMAKGNDGINLSSFEYSIPFYRQVLGLLF